jgi:hypothetical protein
LTDDKKDSALSLLDEIKQAKTKSDPITVDQVEDDPAAELDQSAAENDPSAAENKNIDTPPHPTPQNQAKSYAAPTHTISDKQSPENIETGPLVDSE